MGNSHGRAKPEGQKDKGAAEGPAGGVSPSHSNSSMDSPPDSPTPERSPLMFTPQAPMLPISKQEDFQLGGQGIQGAVQPAEPPLVPVVIRWTNGGNRVFVEGSFDNWRTRQEMTKVGKDFTFVKMLLPGVYQYKFIVDDVWRFAPDQPAMYDSMANVNNVIEVREAVQDSIDILAGFDRPASPPSTYSKGMGTHEDYAKEPPAAPPHLHLTLLNVPTVVAGLYLPRPQHVILNHVYCERSRSAKSSIVVGATHRYKNKYVTLVVYKPAAALLLEHNAAARERREALLEAACMEEEDDGGSSRNGGGGSSHSVARSKVTGDGSGVAGGEDTKRTVTGLASSSIKIPQPSGGGGQMR
eukprot:jgi/Mesvir1/10700/Mv13788-RA.1